MYAQRAFVGACWFTAAALAYGDGPLQPVVDRSVLPVEIRDLPMVGVLHAWGGDTPDSGVAHACLPWHGPTLTAAELPTVWVWEPGAKAAVVAQTEKVAQRGDGLAGVVDLAFPTEIKNGANVRCVFVGGPKPQTSAVDFPVGMNPLVDAKLLQTILTDWLSREYVADLFEKHVQTHRLGPHERMDEFFGVMRPTQPGPKTLPQLFRFHTFAVAYAGSPILEIRMLIENACSERPPGEFFFEECRVSIPERLSIERFRSRSTTHASNDNPIDAAVRFRDSGLISAGRKRVQVPSVVDAFKLGYALDCSLDTTRFFVLPKESERLRRSMTYFVAVPGRDDRQRATWSWNSIPAFGPSWIGIPDGDQPRAALAEQLNREYRDFEKNPALMKQIGGVWVHGDVHGDAPSGEDIAFANPLAVRWIQSGGAWQAGERLEREFRASLHRQRYGFWKPDGSLWTLADRFVGDFEKLDGYTPELNIFSGRPHSEPSCYKFGRDEIVQSPAWQAANAAAEKHKGKRYNELTLYTNYDDEHLCRFTQRLFAFVWLCNDPVAKKLLEAQASISLAAANPFPVSASGDVVSGTVAELKSQTKRKPHAGSYHLARGAGWNAQAICGGLAVTKNPTLKKLGERWLRDFCDTWPEAQLPTGGVHRVAGGQKIDIDLDGDGRIAPAERAVAVDHASIYMQGIFRFAGCRSVRMALDPRRHAAEWTKLAEACKRLDKYFITLAWDDSVDLPGWDMAVSAEADRSKIVAKKVRGGVWGGSESSKFYFDDILAEAHELNPAEPYLQHLLRMHGGERRLVERCGPNSTHAAWVLDRADERR